METLTPTELARRLREPHPPRLLDVREPEEHAFCALPDSRLLPLGELGTRAAELADWEDQEIVVYCHHGIRSARAVGMLHQMGFTRVFNLSGGVDRWTAEVDPAFPRY
ncbi:MAG: hypothetical protein RIS76_35 [Verrucomicrobiota bacterium]|jgi:rhodanese-related sulfurtransferase